jgi:hypothetical protein
MHDPHFGYYLYYPYPYNEIFGPGKKPKKKKVKSLPKLEPESDEYNYPTPLPHNVVE